MAEYIGREAAICVADYATDEHPYSVEKGLVLITDMYNKGWNDACDYIRDELESLPAADVAPVVHGSWEPITNAYGDLEGWICACGRESKERSNYCPHCGAKMETAMPGEEV